MKTMSFVLALLVTCSWSLSAIADDPEPDGVFVINPVLARSCIAVKVSVSENQALAGIRWYNNDSQGAFAKLLVASGEDEVPPLYDDGLVVAENLQGITPRLERIPILRASGQSDRCSVRDLSDAAIRGLHSGG